MSGDPYVVFRDAVDCLEEPIDLGRAALAIARQEYPELSI
jgi:hypothetical protein